MGWLIIMALCAAILLGLWRFAKVSRAALEASAAAMCLALAGYAWQGMPGAAGSPTVSQAESDSGEEGGSVAGADTNAILQRGDALLQLGHARSAAQLYGIAIDKNPKDADLWVGLGQALAVHGGGQVNPASQFAFQRAAEIAPTHPGPPFFFGLALAQQGKFDEAGEVWRGLLARMPKDAPARADLESRLAEINQMSGAQPTPLAQKAD